MYIWRRYKYTKRLQRHPHCRKTKAYNGFWWMAIISCPWRKLYNSHGKQKPELNEYFHMYRCQLKFSLFAVTSGLGFSWQHLKNLNLLLCSVYRFHVYFHIRLILHELGISLPHKDGFSKVKNSYIKSVYYRTCGDYGVDANETWMHGAWFYTTDCAILVMK